MLLAVLDVVVVGRAACIDVPGCASRGCGRASGLYCCCWLCWPWLWSGERPVLMLLAVLAVVVVGRAACIDVAGCVGRGCGRASGLY